MSNDETAAAPTEPSPRPAPPSPTWYDWRRWSLSFLAISILAHLLFGVVATYLIVQVITPKKKSFAGAPAGAPNAPTRALEHKVSMARKQQTMSAPQAVKRVVTTGLSKVALPPMPTMKVDAPVVPMSMAGMGGVGTGLGGLGGGGGNGGNGGLNLFGMRGGGGLEGHFFDLKQKAGGQPSGMNRDAYLRELTRFVQSGWNEASLANYFRAPTPLYATQIFIPTLNAEEGPKAFGVGDKVQANFTAVHYKGKVTAADSGRYRFLGYGDNALVVRFDGRTVLDCGSSNPSGMKPVQYRAMQGETEVGSLGSGSWYHGSGVGIWVEVSSGTAYDMDVLIGEEGGDLSAYFLQIEKDGESYEKDNHGQPILPVFKLGSGEIKIPPRGAGHIGEAPVFAKTGPIWRGVASGSSTFGH